MPLCASPCLKPAPPCVIHVLSDRRSHSLPTTHQAISVQFVSKTFSRGVSGRRTRSDKAWSGDGREGDAAERDGDARRQHPRHPARAALAPAARRRLVALPTAVGRLELHEARLALAAAQSGLRERA